jgi:hypothetical protein
MSQSAHWQNMAAFTSWVWPAYEPFCRQLNPKHWRVLPPTHPAMRAFYRKDGLYVIVSGWEESDGQRWLHLSASRKSKVPSYEDLCALKRSFFGAEAMAYQLFPPQSEHVNDHPFVLHLWACLDGRPTPDFRKGGTI